METFKLFEYNDELIKKSLELWEFDIQNIPLELIQHVPMHGFKVATSSKPLLYVDNLQCCVSVWALAPNFAFASHINPSVIRNDDFYVDSEDNPIKLKRTDDLYNTIMNSDLNKDDPIKIGLTFGVTPLPKDDPNIRLIYEAIEELIIKLKEQSLTAYFVERNYEMNFILDSRNGKVIVPEEELETKKVL